MANADYINFNVDGQKLSYTQKHYTSTGTIDTLFVRYKFKPYNSGNVGGGWDLPHLWTQFHDKYGNVYVKPVKDNTCSIPYDCLRHTTFKMTLFATDTEDYMVCKKRYATNEILFRFNGQANLNYDGGVSPDEPPPTHWQIILDKVDECESSVDKLSQDVSAMGDRVDTFDGRVTANENDIEDLNTRLANESSARANADADLQSLIDDERTARENADIRLEGLIGDRYTKAQTDTLIGNEATARSNADANLQSLINDRYTKIETDALVNAESTARESADADLQSLINNRYTKSETDDLLDAKQDKLSASQMNAVNSGLTSSDKAALDDLSYTATSGNIPINTESGIIGSQNIKLTRVGRLVELSFTYGNYDSASYGIYNNVYTIPIEFRPQTEKSFVVYSRTQGRPLGITVKKNGNIDFQVMTGWNAAWNLNGCNTLMYFI